MYRRRLEDDAVIGVATLDDIGVPDDPRVLRMLVRSAVAADVRLSDLPVPWCQSSLSCMSLGGVCKVAPPTGRMARRTAERAVERRSATEPH